MEQLNQTVLQEEGFKAALYLRLSKEDGDREESDSIQNQRELLRAHITKYLPEVTVVAEKVDESVIVEPSQKTLAAQGFLVWFNFFIPRNG